MRKGKLFVGVVCLALPVMALGQEIELSKHFGKNALGFRPGWRPCKGR